MIWENSIEICILSSMKQIASPGWMHETSARGWCTGKTQRDGMGRDVGGGIRMGNTCKSMADSCQCMAKSLQYCKVISLQLIKINEKKEENQCSLNWPWSLPRGSGIRLVLKWQEKTLGMGEYGVMVEKRWGTDGQLDWKPRRNVEFDELMHREETDSTRISGRV